MLKTKERRMVLDYLYQECVVASKDPSEVLKRTGCMIEAKMKYESMSSKEQVKMYKVLLEKEIVNYFLKNLRDSLTMNWVNGSPDKREARIREYAINQYNNLSKTEKIAICEKLGYRLL